MFLVRGIEEVLIDCIFSFLESSVAGVFKLSVGALLFVSEQLCFGLVYVVEFLLRLPWDRVSLTVKFRNH